MGLRGKYLKFISKAGQTSNIEEPGKTYYVNNITGTSTGSGESWESAMSQVSTAITASEVYRLAQAANNTFVRNKIIIQGTATRYTLLTALPNWTDVIGIGADPRGNGSGIVRIGSVSGADGATGSGGSTDMRGTNWYNIQFNAGGNYYAFHAPVAYRCRFENCTFGCADDNATAYGGLYIESGSGVVLKDCATIHHSGTLVTGVTVGNSGGNFNECKIIDCVFQGSTAGFSNSAYLCNNSVMQNCIVVGGTNGIVDTSTETTLLGNMWYVGNFCYGSQSTGANAGGMKVTNNPTLRCIGNKCSDGGTGHEYVTVVGSA
jgi:hypothetical protein